MKKEYLTTYLVLGDMTPIDKTSDFRTGQPLTLLQINIVLYINVSEVLVLYCNISLFETEYLVTPTVAVEPVHSALV